MKPIYQYTDDDALREGVFVDVTPKSMVGKCQIVCTPTIKAEFSMAAIMEMYNSFVLKFKTGLLKTRPGQNYCTMEKMNGQDVWVHSCILGGKAAIKMFFQSEA